MDSRVRVLISTIPRNLIVAVGLLIVLPVVGTVGYITIEGWSFLDAVYMTAITMTTIGFEEVRPLTDSGRVFTIPLAISGVSAVFYGGFSQEVGHVNVGS